MNAKRILFINPGPVFRVKDSEFVKHFIHLSEYFCGDIYTTTSSSEDFRVGNFRFLSISNNGKPVPFLKFRKFCLDNVKRDAGNPFDLISTYDPLKTGLIGAEIAKTIGTRLAIEVNGVYTAPGEWLDDRYYPMNQIKKRVYPLLMRYTLGRADGVRLLYKEQIDPFKSILADKMIVDFRRYVDSRVFVPISEKREVLFAGFPFKRKGVDVLIAAFKKVSPKYPDWTLKILGWFKDGDALKKAIDNHPRIYHHPPVHANEMPQHIGNCGIFVLPSRSEAMGRVLLEAMAAGKPRIGSRVDGIPTVIDDRVDGLLCEPGNVDDLKEKLDLLMGDETLRKELGAAGRQRALTEFTHEKYMKNVREFYTSVLVRA
ncbi:glycosyltransferase family 4 protein [Wenzhouxiangella sp. XN24]|uniref:glycosyltransferase family 4 protein n=1 Tax=Wenzhouxiangella sp. XN24 TaxID=2713569 RepID=UPI0013ECD43B|nr:glycosyltransferase family 4 protein [Wenzhouxiangella sp. XN24]NGX17086.1 glycosyltransferase family 4 protein [Wenzhouxiangella sp. XN24]